VLSGDLHRVWGERAVRITRRFFPHPVLSPFSDDLAGSSFSCSIDVTRDASAYAVSGEFSLSDRKLEELIASGTAAFALHIECPRARHRDIHTTHSRRVSFRVSADHLSGRVELCPLVVATQDIPAYTNPSFHPDYQHSAFHVRRGDILALGDGHEFTADADALRPVPSIFDIVRNDAADPPAIDISLVSDRVAVLLSPRMYAAYTQLRMSTDCHSMLSSAIILPALIATLWEMAHGDDQEGGEHGRWRRTIEGRLAELGSSLGEISESPRSALPLASEMLGDPGPDALERLLRFGSGVDDEE
jgi:hypothetical protein